MRRYMARLLAVILCVTLTAGSALAWERCEHRNKTVVSQSEDRHLSEADANDNHHFVVIFTDYRCNDCGSQWPEITDQYIESHSFTKETKEDANGVTTWDRCTLCGHTCNRVVSSPCTHGWDYMYGKVYPQFDATYVGAVTRYEAYADDCHGEIKVKSYQCNSCGKVLTAEEQLFPSVACTYVNGVCKCGNTKTPVTPTPTATPTPTPTAIPEVDPPTPEPCGHDDHYSWVSESVYTYKQYSDSQHVRVEMSYWRCPCGEIMSESGPWEKYERHNFANGVCRDCGYQQQETATTPPAPPSTTVPGACTHKTSKERLSESWSVLDEDRHIMSTVYRHSCECGQVSYTQTEEGYFRHQVKDGKCWLCGYTAELEQSSCGINGHELYLFYYDGLEYRRCLNCDYQEAVVTNESAWWERYLEMEDIANVNGKWYSELTGATRNSYYMWKIVAAQARERLQDETFVKSTTFADTYAKQSGSVLEMLKEVLSEENQSAKRVQLWEDLIIQMLNKDQDYHREEKSITARIAETVQADAEVAKILGSTASLTFESLEWADYGDVDTYMQKIEMDMKAIADKKLTEPGKDAAYEILDNKIEKAKKDAKAFKQVDDASKMLGVSMTILSGVMEGAKAEEEFAAIQRNYEELTEFYTAHIRTLIAIRYDAASMSCDELVTAVDNVIMKLEKEYQEKKQAYAVFMGECLEVVADGLESMAAGIVPSLKSVAAGLSDIVLGAALPVLDATSFFASAYQSASNTDEVFQSAEKLMYLADMSNQIQLSTALKNERSSTDIYRLWSELQAEGCEAAATFVNVHVDNWSAQDVLSTDIGELGIKNSEREKVLSVLGNEQDMYEKCTEIR